MVEHEILKLINKNDTLLPEEKPNVKADFTEIVAEQQKTIQETNQFIKELTQLMKIQHSEVEEIKRLLENEHEQTDIDALLKEALQLLIKRLK